MEDYQVALLNSGAKRRGPDLKPRKRRSYVQIVADGATYHTCPYPNCHRKYAGDYGKFNLQVHIKTKHQDQPLAQQVPPSEEALPYEVPEMTPTRTWNIPFAASKDDFNSFQTEEASNILAQMPSLRAPVHPAQSPAPSTSTDIATEAPPAFIPSAAASPLPQPSLETTVSPSLVDPPPQELAQHVDSWEQRAASPTTSSLQPLEKQQEQPLPKPQSRREAFSILDLLCSSESSPCAPEATTPTPVPTITCFQCSTTLDSLVGSLRRCTQCFRTLCPDCHRQIAALTQRDGSLCLLCS